MFCTFLRNLDVDIDLPHFLDVRHLPEAGHHVQRVGQLEAGQLARELAVDVALEHPDESILERIKIKIRVCNHWLSHLSLGHSSLVN